MASDDHDRQLALSVANKLDSSSPMQSAAEVETSIAKAASSLITVGEPQAEEPVDPTDSDRRQSHETTTASSTNSSTQTETPSFATSLQHTKESLKASDVMISCGDDTFQVHRAVVCPQSPFFKAALEAGFKESFTRTIKLEEESPLTIARLMSFLYMGSYGGVSSTQSNPFYVHQIETKQQTAEQHHETLMLHSTMYACSVRYGVAALKEQALLKFKDLLLQRWPMHDLPALVAAVYSTTPPNDKGLRDRILVLCLEHLEDITLGPLWQQITKIESAGALGLELVPLIVKRNITINKREEERREKERRESIFTPDSSYQSKKRRARW
ncbi:MAG: hypothetical protein Q9170_004156 [Blastenia crenularia]